MNFYRTLFGRASHFALVLLFILGISGCNSRLPKKTVTFNCGDQTVDVDPNVGVKPTAIYSCENDTVTWDAHGNQFKVEFKGNSPFSNDEKVFHNDRPKSAGAKHFTELTVYEYKITVGNKVFDPQVIGGGGY